MPRLPHVIPDPPIQENFDALTTAHPFTPQPAATIPPNILFLDAATSKLSFKDATGTIHALY